MQNEISNCISSDLKKDQSKSNINPGGWFFYLQKIVWNFLLAPYFKCLFKYSQIAVWVLWFLKMSLNQVWSDSAIVPTANLIVWQWYRTFNGSGTPLHKGAILDMQNAS